MMPYQAAMFILLLGCSVYSFAGGDSERGREAFEICATCHGEMAEGSEDFGAPRLTGQHPWYLATQLENFRAGIRGTHEDDDNGQVMQPMAEELTDDDISDLLAYIITLQ